MSRRVRASAYLASGEKYLVKVSGGANSDEKEITPCGITIADMTKTYGAIAMMERVNDRVLVWTLVKGDAKKVDGLPIVRVDSTAIFALRRGEQHTDVSVAIVRSKGKDITTVVLRIQMPKCHDEFKFSAIRAD